MELLSRLVIRGFPVAKSNRFFDKSASLTCTVKCLVWHLFNNSPFHSLPPVPFRSHSLHIHSKLNRKIEITNDPPEIANPRSFSFVVPIKQKGRRNDPPKIENARRSTTQKGRRNDPPNIKNARRSTKQNRRPFTTEEDILILHDFEIQGDKPETWKNLAKKLGGDPPRTLLTVKRRLELIVHGVTKDKKRFTTEDDKLIIAYIKKHGNNVESWKNLATQFKPTLTHSLHLEFRTYIRFRHRVLLTNKQSTSRKFTPEEDELILDYIKRYGDTLETYKTVAKKLGRNYHQAINERHKLLTSNLSKTPLKWSLSDDKNMLEILFKVSLRMERFS